MQTDLYTKTGTKATAKVTLDDAVFGSKINQQLMTQAIYVYLNNQRQSNAQVKDKSMVSGGGKKPWRQKGTGRARHGSTRSPIWTHGGVTFGPTNARNYKKDFSKKMRKQAILSALSTKAKNKELVVFEGFEIGGKQLTKSFSTVLKKAGVADKTLIIQAAADKNLLKAAANMSNVHVEVVNAINTYQILKYKNLVILKDALDIMSQFWGGKAKKVAVETVAVKKETVPASKQVKAVAKPLKTKAATKKVAVKKTVKAKKVTKK